MPDNGKLIVNDRKSPEQLRREQKISGREVWVVPATDLSIEMIGRNIPNTAMLGATVKATNVVKLESLMEATRQRFSGKIGDINVQLIKRAHQEAKQG
jgi:pyruvate ferredoxin oxidoreductase gamma subunit